MGNFTDEAFTPPSVPRLGIHSPEVGSIAQSDASEFISSSSKHLNPSSRNPVLHIAPKPSIVSEEWTSATIVLTAVISSFIAIILVLLLILSALLFRQKLVAQGKIPPGSNIGTLVPHYENRHPFEFGGYVAPEDVRKAKGGALPGEYQEPFADPQFSSFVAASNGFMSQNVTSGNSSNNGSNGNGRMAEYYSCTLVSNPLNRDPPSNLNGMRCKLFCLI